MIARGRLLLLLLLLGCIGVVFALLSHRSREHPTMATPPAPPRRAGLAVVVRKAERRLLVYRDGDLIHTYCIGLGFTPTGHKRREGDGRTPEGDYIICVRNPKSRYHLSLGVSYPSAKDARRGLASGLITREQHDSIVEATAKGLTPPWDTPLGGEVFIHGHGSHRDWTLGCIALDDEDMDVLYALTPKRTPLRVDP